MTNLQQINTINEIPESNFQNGNNYFGLIIAKEEFEKFKEGNAKNILSKVPVTPIKEDNQPDVEDYYGPHICI